MQITANTIDEAREQIREYFSRSGAKLAIDDRRHCKYRMPDGSACAVGCLIPDSEYALEIEGVSVHSIIPHYDLELRCWLNDVQSAHDDATSVDDLLVWLDHH